MKIDNSTAVNNGGNMTVHGVVGGSGNQVTVTHTAAAASSSADELLRVFTGIRATVAAGTDLAVGLKQRVLDGTEEAEYRVSTGELPFAGTILRHMRAELDAVQRAGGSSATAVCLLLDKAVKLVGE